MVKGDASGVRGERESSLWSSIEWPGIRTPEGPVGEGSLLFL